MYVYRLPKTIRRKQRQIIARFIINLVSLASNFANFDVLPETKPNILKCVHCHSVCMQEWRKKGHVNVSNELKNICKLKK
jgi:hypothetical protein